MKRDVRLRGLSSEHHHALVFARSVTDHLADWTPDDGAALERRFALAIDPHFRIEDELLLPALRSAGAADLVERTAEDHAYLRRHAEAAGAGDADVARAFAMRLIEHVRFEERDLFPACEELLTSEALDEVARRAPKEP